MNNSKIFKMAHQITRETIKEGDDYRATFAATLRILYREVHAAEKYYQEVSAWMTRPDEIKYDIATYERRIKRPTMSFDRKIELMGRIAYCSLNDKIRTDTFNPDYIWPEIEK